MNIGFYLMFGYIFKALRYYTFEKCFLNVFIRDWKSVLNIHWRDWCWSWNSNILATWCKELTHWKRPWCWERLKAGGERDNRGWDGWMASPTQWTWVCINSGSWWWTGRPGVLQSMGLQSVGHNWVTELKLCLREALAVCTPPAPEPSAKRPGS